MLVTGIVITAVVAMFTMSWWSMLFVPLFFWWYIIEWVLRSVFGRRNAYKNICFEREAYANQCDSG